MPKASICACPPGTPILAEADCLPGSVSMPAEPAGTEVSAAVSWPACPGTTAAVTRTPRSEPAPGSGQSRTDEPMGWTDVAPAVASGMGCWSTVAARVLPKTASTTIAKGRALPNAGRPSPRIRFARRRSPPAPTASSGGLSSTDPSPTGSAKSSPASSASAAAAGSSGSSARFSRRTRRRKAITPPPLPAGNRRPRPCPRAGRPGPARSSSCRQVARRRPRGHRRRPRDGARRARRYR